MWIKIQNAEACVLVCDVSISMVKILSHQGIKKHSAMKQNDSGYVISRSGPTALTSVSILDLYEIQERFMKS